MNMENSQFYEECNDDQQLSILRAGIQEGNMLYDTDIYNSGELPTIADDELFPAFYEEASYHELRCISNSEYEEEDEFDRTKQIYNNLDHSYNRISRKHSDNGFSNALENTDDQLFIEIVKEEFKADTKEKNSIFDTITFNIDHEDNVKEIKIIETKENFPNEQPRYLFFKKPEVTIPQRKTQMVRIVESKPRKPIELANYRNLITEAIKSSPEKRMILTDIYKWIIENVPFFREKEIRGKNGWKNCVRHTLSVNERFIRIKNRTNIRSSYWTVCEEGDVNSKLATFPWASEIFKPEERKRPRFKRKQKNSDGENKKVHMNGEKKIKVNDKTEIPVKRKRGRPPINRNINIQCSEISNSKTLIKNRQCQVNTTGDTVNKKVTNYQTRLQSFKRGKIIRENIPKNVKDSVPRTKKGRSKNKNKRRKQPQTVRRSNRKRVARKTWKL